MLHRPNDAGLARERTALAWSRTALAVAVCIAGLVRHLWPFRDTARVAVLVLIVAGAALWTSGATLFARDDLAAGAHDGARSQAFLLITAGTIALACVGAALTFVRPA